MIESIVIDTRRVFPYRGSEQVPEGVTPPTRCNFYPSHELPCIFNYFGVNVQGTRKWMCRIHGLWVYQGPKETVITFHYRDGSTHIRTLPHGL